MVRASARPAGCTRTPCVIQDRCQACTECEPLIICPGRAFERDSATGRVRVAALDSCYSCLMCVTVCPHEAVWSD